MSQRRHPLLVSMSVTLLLALAEGPSPAAGGKWERAVENLESQLRRGDWKRTMERCVTQRNKMIDKFTDPAINLELVAQTLLLQAVAEANLGRDDDALWHWFSAQNYLDGLAELDLSDMGRAQSVLGGRSLADIPEATGSSDQSERSRYREVKIKKPVRPTYPKALVKSGIEGGVVIKVIVGTDGMPHQPVVLEAGLRPLMAFPALEALRSWRFTPAQESEKPIAVYYELKIDYP